MEVEIVGGPDDGKVIALPEGTHTLYVPVVMNPREWLLQLGDEPPAAALDVRRVDMPIVLTRNGYRAYWKEPRC